MKHIALYFYTRPLSCAFVFTLLCLLSLATKAQQNESGLKGSISGMVTDSISGLPIEYATIGLILQESNKTVNGVTSDDKGLFKLSNVPPGVYTLQFYFIGYNAYTVKNISITKSGSHIALGSVKLLSSQATLKEVTIVTEKSLIENKIDKLVYNADKDLTSQGGVATDILRKVPQISVDVNGNVEVQGNANIRFLINGKPSSMFGNNIADVLQSIPANQVQSIEVVTSPGARYDAEGGSIINIILKKNTARGFNGNVSLSAGTRLENAALNLSARKGKFGTSAFFSGNAQLPSTTLNKMSRNTRDDATAETSQLQQNGSSSFERRGYQSGLNIDWALTQKDNLSASLTYNYFYNNTDGVNTRLLTSRDSSGTIYSDIASQVSAINKLNSHNLDWSLNYKHNFKKEGQEMEFLFTNSSGNNNNYYSQTQKLLPAYLLSSGSYGKNPGLDQQSNISVNYTQPLGKTVILETGGKAVLSRLNTNSDVYVYNAVQNDYTYNTSQSSSLTYNRNIYASYLSAVFKLFDFLDIKTGLRYEYTETEAHFSGVNNFTIKPYNTLVPSVVVSRAFKKHQSVKLSYSRRISRPGYRDVNPFVNATDPKNISTGNPDVLPEISENIEFGYTKVFEKGANINASGFLRGNYQDIQPYSKYYSSIKLGDSTYNNVSVSTRENIGTEYNIGINLFVSVPFTSGLNLRANISAYQRYIQSIYPDGSIQGFMYRTNVTASYAITNLLSAELFGNFNSPRINAQGVQPSFTTYNLAIRHQLFHKNGSIALTATNPFNRYVNQKTELNGTNFTSVNTLQLPYRSFGFNFTYKFGKMEFKKQKELEDVNLTNPSAPGN